MVSSNIPDSIPPSSSLVEIGALLRQARTTQDVSLEQASRTVRIRPDFLNSLEAAQLDCLPERVYVRGFIKTYGNYLGLDGEALASQFAAIDLVGNPKTLRSPKHVRIQLRPLHAWMAYVALIVAAVGGITALLDRHQTSIGGPDSSKQLPSEAEVAGLESQSEAPPESPFQRPEDWTYIAGVFPQSADTPGNGRTYEGLTVSIEVVESPSWMRVVADRQTVFEGMLQPGADREWQANESLAIVAGNAGGVVVSLNGEQLGLMGQAGQVREQSFWLAEDGSVEVR